MYFYSNLLCYLLLWYMTIVRMKCIMPNVSVEILIWTLLLYLMAMGVAEHIL